MHIRICDFSFISHKVYFYGNDHMNLQKNIKFVKKNIELLVWTGSLMALWMMNPSKDQHFSLCLFKLLGFHYCPGCGLGHSVSFLLHGNIKQAVISNRMGLFALPVLLHRIFTLSVPLIFNHHMPPRPTCARCGGTRFF